MNNKESIQILQLEKQLAYYKKQVDRLSGTTLSNQYAFTQLSNVCRKYINGFQIIADIQRSFSFYSSKELLYDQFLDSILSQMFLDRVILFEIIPGKIVLQTILCKGFNKEESSQIINIKISITEEFLSQKKSILVNGETESTPFEKTLQNNLLTPHFILTPLVKNQQVWGFLFVGMLKEFNTISYIPLSVSNIEMFESLAGALSSMTQQLEQRELMEKERNRIARDMHDDIGSELSRIIVIGEQLKNRYHTHLDIIKDLNIIKESTASIVNNIGNIIWALNPGNNTIDGLMGYMREYIFDYLEMHGISVTFHLPETHGNLIISHEIRTHIFMVVKEALHNIVKHAGATAAEIKIYFSQNKLGCFIVDNGSGFSVTTKNGFGNGLRNMQQRINETGGTLVIYSELGIGTRLELEVPILMLQK